MSSLSIHVEYISIKKKFEKVVWPEVKSYMRQLYVGVFSLAPVFMI